MTTELNNKFGNADALLQQEFSEAWAHYRHLEASRSKYLGFFFTVLIATSGFVLTIFKDFGDSQEPWVYFGLISLVWIVSILSFFIFTTIKKSGFVLKHYEDVMKEVRHLSYDQAIHIDALMNVREKNHPVMKMALFSTQQTAEIIPLGTTIILCAINSSALISMWGSKSLLPWQQWTSLCIISILVLSLVYVITRLIVFQLIQKPSTLRKTEQSNFKNNSAINEIE